MYSECACVLCPGCQSGGCTGPWLHDWTNSGQSQCSQVPLSTRSSKLLYLVFHMHMHDSIIM